jgi:TatD DNase family protein
MLQDSHAHFQAVKDPSQMESVLSLLRSNGVGRIFCNATSPEDWDEVRGYAERHEEVVPFFGIHPWFADSAIEGWESKLLSRLVGGRAGIGEIGLDRAREGLDLGVQRLVFDRQLDMAFSLNRPFTLHCVDAWGMCIESISGHGKGTLPFVAHSFSGPVEVMKEIVRLGGYISFSLKLLEKRFTKVQEAFAQAPLDRILLETDFPYAPGSMSKVPASPGDYLDCVRRIYNIAAQMKGISPELLEKAVWDNGTVFVY